MLAQPITLLQVGLTATQRSIVRDAAAAAFVTRSVQLRTSPDFDRALEEETGAALLVLHSPSGAQIEQALAARDGGGLPRWGVVVVGAEAVPTGVEEIDAIDFEARTVARVLRSTHYAWQLRRDLERERGDVWTLGRRMTHDLRNPLGCIVTTAEMLKEILRDESPDNVPLIGAVIESSAEMLEMINRIHFIAKASAQPKPPQTLNMDSARQAALERLQREITERQAIVEGPEEWPDVSGVQGWLESVWQDLIANALRHGGTPPKIETGWRREGAIWVFWVSDSGPGVAPERVGQLFTPFHRLHLRHGGGLGLSVVQRLVELQGGTCGYERNPAGGARFVFSLPAQLPSPAQPLESMSPVQGHAGAATDLLSASPSSLR